MIRHREQFAIGESPRIWPVRRIGLAKDLGDLLELVHLGRAWEERLKGVKFRHDAPKRKYVYRVVIAATTKDIFWGSVPARRHVLGEGRRVADLFNEAKITELHRGLFLDKDILRFNVSMEEAVTVDVVECRCDLIDDVPDLFMRERVIVKFSHLHHSVEVHVE